MSKLDDIFDKYTVSLYSELTRSKTGAEIITEMKLALKSLIEDEVRKAEDKLRMDNIYALGGITDYQITLFKGNKEVTKTPIYDIHTQLVAQDLSEEGEK